MEQRKFTGFRIVKYSKSTEDTGQRDLQLKKGKHWLLLLFQRNELC